MKSFLVLAVLLGSVTFFVTTATRMLAYVRLGKPENRLDHIGERLMSLLIYFFGQKKVAEPVSYEHRPGLTSLHHIWIFAGFMVITVGTAELFIEAITGWNFSFIGETPYQVYRVAVDTLNALVLAMVLFAVFRRTAVRPKMIPLSADATIILAAIAGLMITHFGYHALKFVAEGEVEPWARTVSLSGLLGHKLMGKLSMEGALVGSELCFWVHILLVLGFLNYLPFSKHIHILTAGPNIFFRNLGQRGVLPLLNLEADDPSKIGIVETFQDFTWKSLFDSLSCTECARCSNFCPAYATAKPLSPMHLIHDVRDDMLARGPLLALAQAAAANDGHGHADHGHADHGHADHGHADHGHADHGHADHGDHGHAGNGEAQATAAELPPLVGGRVRDDTLWACTTCGACQEVCPVFIDHPKQILEMRRNLVLLSERTPPELARTFRNLERQGNPWGIAGSTRMDWAQGLDVPLLDDHPDAEYLLWVGCAGAFDERIRKTTIALVEVLRSAEVSFAVLGEREGCSGDPARRTGNEMLYQEQAKANVEAMNDAKVRKVITACPHCLHTIKNEYPQLGGNFEVYHHTQIMKKLVDDGLITLEKGVGKTMTYHDPCYLGRWNGEYEAPRALLGALPQSGGFIELDRVRERSFCCGAGGGGMWMEDKSGERVNENRVAEILTKPVDTVAVACPFCTIMVEDGLKACSAEEKVQVLDVAQVIAKSMIKRYKGHPVPEPPHGEDDA